METTLLIMAAGLGSRFKGGLKQLASVDDYGHIIMDYSIHDALEAGFRHVVFIIRKDIEADFRETIGSRVEAVCARLGVSVDYAFQSLEDIPGVLPEGRTKPWGTGQAVLCARELVNGPFSVINADDFYGKQAFVQLHRYLIDRHKNNAVCMAGFILKNTLSEHGGVTRGICEADAQGYLTSIKETRHIVKTPEGASADGVPVDADAMVSMNMWGFPSPIFMDVLEYNFRKFFDEAVPNDPMKSEFLLPTLIGKLLEKEVVTVRVLPTMDRWYGVTYAEDRAAVTQSINRMVADGIYRADLYSDL